jgi:hypothetical protein
VLAGVGDVCARCNEKIREFATERGLPDLHKRSSCSILRWQHTEALFFLYFDRTTQVDSHSLSICSPVSFIGLSSSGERTGFSE